MPNKRDRSKVQVGAFIPREVRDIANKIAAKYGINMSDEILKAYQKVIDLDRNRFEQEKKESNDDRK